MSDSGQGMDRRLERPRGKHGRLVMIGGAALALLAAIALGVGMIPPPGSLTVKASDVEIGQVRTAPFQDYLPVRAEVAPLHTVFVTAVEGGQVEKVVVLDGTEVAAGAALATLTNPVLRLDVTSREADIAGKLGDASAQQLTLERNRLDREKEISETNYDLLKAEHDLEVRRALHDQGFVSDAEVKTFADQAGYYQSRLKELKTGQTQEDAIAGAQAAQLHQTSGRLNNNLDVVRSSLDALTVRAPVAGRLTDFTLEPGQSLKAGDPVGQIDSEGAYKLTADVDEFYLGRVTPGQQAVADLDGRSVAMTVSRVLPQVTNGRFRAELTFKDAPPAGLRRGEGVDIRITLGDTRPALVLPNSGWLEAGGGTYAFVVQSGGGRADRRAITIGRRNPEQVEITSGLRPGERVTVSSYAGFDKFAHLILH
ncbi:MAG: efflux RND transporter periplasmic adaptor subunit [Caulobacteraceae bacterium]